MSQLLVRREGFAFPFEDSYIEPGVDHNMLKTRTDAATDSGVSAAIEAIESRRAELAAHEALQLPASVIAKHLASLLG